MPRSPDGVTVTGGTEYLDAGHVVQFYGHQEELAGRVAGHLLEALRGEGVAVVIATPAHRRAIEARLAQAGPDLAAAARDGTYLTLDASDTIRGLMTGGRLDRDAFDRVIGGLIRRAEKGAGEVGRRRPVRAYGEMVAVLWDAGLVNAAVELEEMWGELGLRRSFSLLCGYPVSSVSDGHPEAFAEVCRLHRSVAGGWPSPPAPGTTRTFALSSDAPAAARHFAAGALRRLGATDLAADTALVVTELAANAVVHAHTGFTVELTASAEVLRIAVADASPLPPGAGLPVAPLHGLGAVDAMASRWGVEPLGHSGKSVWVELSR
jgi:MEDS: MEthanogen/methylotroph, DcmR Sensory domain